MIWNDNGISYQWGFRDVLIARFDSVGRWYCNIPIMTQQSMKACFKELGEFLGAQSVEVKYLYDENDNATVSETIDFMKLYDGSYKFKICKDY